MYRQFIKKDILTEESVRVFITGIRRDSFNRILKNVLGMDEDDLNSERFSVQDSKENHHDHIENFQKLGPNVVWLEKKKKLLISSGNSCTLTGELQKYIEKIDKLDTRCDENFCNLGSENEIFIIANNPGMGKSTFLTHVANKIKEKNRANQERHFWIVRINLPEYVQKNRSPDFENKNFLEFVMKIAVPDDSEEAPFILFQQKLFKASFQNTKTETNLPRVVIQVDGFDEICPYYKNKATELLEFLAKSQIAQLWVTTNLHEKIYLEIKLNSQAYILQPFSEEDQVNFQNRYWKWILKFNNDSSERNECTIEEIIEKLDNIRLKNIKLEKIIDDSKVLDFEDDKNVWKVQRTIDNKLNVTESIRNVIAKWAESIGDEFFNVPFNLKMLIDVIFKRNLELCLLELYHEFWNFHKNIIKKAKNVGHSNMQNLEKHHIHLAKKMFPEILKKVTVEPMYNDGQSVSANIIGDGEVSEEDKWNLIAIGILVLNGDKLEFTHKCYADYFLCKYLFFNVKKLQDFLDENLFLIQNHKLIHEFFKNQLKKAA